MEVLLSKYLPVALAYVVAALVSSALVFSFIGGAAFIYIWGERKVSGRIQDRLGPTRVGPFGLLQSLADGIKLVTKEDFAPDNADKALFRLAPFFAFCATFAGFIALPFADGIVVFPIGVGAFFMLAVLSSEVFGILLAGYASGSKWSLFGGVREAAQVVSYEVPRSICVIVPICIAGTLDLSVISHQQAGWFWNWNLFHDPFTYLAAFLFFLVATASCKRAPFDLAEAESELVGGFHTEYSGMRWSYFFLAEYASMFAVSGLACYLFFGGWHSGFLPYEPSEHFGFWLGNLINFVVFVLKGSLLVFVMMWMRWSLPRLRIDQVMITCLKYFLPLSCVLLLGVCVWQILVPKELEPTIRMILGIGNLVIGLGLALSLLRPSPSFPSGKLAGAWAK